MITYIVVFMSYSGPVVIGRYSDAETCKIIAEQHGAICGMAVKHE
jgi:hypothetical protein